MFIAAPLWFGLNVDAGLIINALAALGSLAAAAAAVWIATTDRKQRQQEQEESDRKQAGLVRLTSRWDALGTPEASLFVTVKNFGKLPIVDVAVTRWELDGRDVIAYSVTAPIEAVLPYTGTPDTAAVFKIGPQTRAMRIAMEGERHPGNVELAGANKLKKLPTVSNLTDLTVTIQFTDAGEKRWRRSNKGLLERA